VGTEPHTTSIVEFLNLLNELVFDSEFPHEKKHTHAHTHTHRILLLYKVCVRPIYDYACQVWNDASESSKHSILDSLQHRLLARAMGVRRGTSALALQVEAGIAPLSERRRFLTAMAYSRYVHSEIRVGRLVRDHREGHITLLNSDRHVSFSRRGELMVRNGSYPSVGTRSDFQRALLRNWQHTWTTSDRGRAFFALQPKVSFKPERWTTGLPRWAISVLAGMRLGGSVLNVHLYRDCLVSSELCDCGAVETIEHFWLHCPNFQTQRRCLVTVFSNVIGRRVVPGLPFF